MLPAHVCLSFMGCRQNGAMRVRDTGKLACPTVMSLNETILHTTEPQIWVLIRNTKHVKPNM